jgi:hypothetical protein
VLRRGSSLEVGGDDEWANQVFFGRMVHFGSIGSSATIVTRFLGTSFK